MSLPPLPPLESYLPPLPPLESYLPSLAPLPPSPPTPPLPQLSPTQPLSPPPTNVHSMTLRNRDAIQNTIQKKIKKVKKKIQTKKVSKPLQEELAQLSAPRANVPYNIDILDIYLSPNANFLKVEAKEKEVFGYFERKRSEINEIIPNDDDFILVFAHPDYEISLVSELDITKINYTINLFASESYFFSTLEEEKTISYLPNYRFKVYLDYQLCNIRRVEYNREKKFLNIICTQENFRGKNEKIEKIVVVFNIKDHKDWNTSKYIENIIFNNLKLKPPEPRIRKKKGK